MQGPAGSFCRVAIHFASPIHHCHHLADVKTRTPNMGVSHHPRRGRTATPDTLARLRSFSHIIHKSISCERIQDKCLIRRPRVPPHPLEDAPHPVGIIGQFRFGRGEASPGKRSQPIRPGFPGRPPSDVHRSFGARKTKPEFGHCPGHCPQFGMLAFTVDNRSRKTPAKKDPDPLSRWFSPL